MRSSTKSVVRVGGGRGFIIQHRQELPPFRGQRLFRHDRFVITAAHCLPRLPPCHGMSYLTRERTYARLLGPLGGSKPKVWTECVFADPIADIAVLGSPDNQELSEEAEAYEALTNEVPAFRIGRAPAEGHAWLLTLEGKWTRFVLKLHGHSLGLEDPSRLIKGGMSGSPILIDKWTAIGVLCLGGGWFEPRLEHNLPGWLLKD